jgi:hypothetical protein
MKTALIQAGVGALLLLAGCTNHAMLRGDCEGMLTIERQRCLAANASNQQIVAERTKAARTARESRGEFDRDKIQLARDSQ